MRSGSAQQIISRLPPLRDLKKLRLDSVMNYLRRHPVVSLQIVTRSPRNSNQPARAPHRHPEKKLPERQIEPAEEFRMPLVRPIVKHGDHRPAEKAREGERGI